MLCSCHHPAPQDFHLAKPKLGARSQPPPAPPVSTAPMPPDPSSKWNGARVRPSAAALFHLRLMSLKGRPWGPLTCPPRPTAPPAPWAHLSPHSLALWWDRDDTEPRALYTRTGVSHVPTARTLGAPPEHREALGGRADLPPLKALQTGHQIQVQAGRSRGKRSPREASEKTLPGLSSPSFQGREKACLIRSSTRKPALKEDGRTCSFQLLQKHGGPSAEFKFDPSELFLAQGPNPQAGRAPRPGEHCFCDGHRIDASGLPAPWDSKCPRGVSERCLPPRAVAPRAAAHASTTLPLFQAFKGRGLPPPQAVPSSGEVVT